MNYKIYTLVIVSLLFTTSLFAQRIGNLNGINYQAVALAAEGKEVVGKNLEARPLYMETIDVRFTIQKGGQTDATIEYQETHTTMTDEDGLFSLVIGHGTTTAETQYDSLLAIPWIDADQFLKVEIAVEGEDFRTVSIEKFQSVPYSFYTDNIADDAITTEKILNEEILAEDINTGAVETDEILNATILNEDIADATIDLTAKVQNVLPVPNGGTGRGAVDQGDILIGNGSGALDTLAVYDSAMLFSNANGNTELFKLRAGPRTTLDVDEVNKTITITAIEQAGTNTGVGDVSVPNLAPGDQVERNFPSAGVQPGDIILATVTTDLKGLTVTAYVRQEGQVIVVFFNGSNQNVNLGPVSVNFANFGQP